MKKISVLTIILFITLIFCGCVKHKAAVGSSNSSVPATSESASGKNQQNTASSMNDINSSMDKLDGALGNSDNSNDINATESLINNIN